MPTVIALDFETSDRYADSACALGMVRMDEGKIVSSLYHLIRPPRSRVYFTEIHGLTWAMLRDQPTFADLWPSFSAFWEGADLFVAHNASFDRRVLLACCAACGVDAPTVPFACTVKGARLGLRLPRHRLNDVCSYLHIELNHHHADSDAMAAGLIYLYLRRHGLSDEDMLLNTPRRKG